MGTRDRLRDLDRRVFDGDHWFGRANSAGEQFKRTQYKWVGRHRLVVLVLAAVAIALVIAFGRG